MGQLQTAKEHLDKAKELDPADPGIQKEVKKFENVQNFERVVSRHLEKGDYDTALNYIDQILQECVSSEAHSFQKLEY